MPCYDPPMPWERAATENNMQAVGILCRMLTAKLHSEENLTKEEAKWLLEHRRIDLLKEEAFGTKEVAKVKADIARLEELLNG